MATYANPIDLPYRYQTPVKIPQIQLKLGEAYREAADGYLPWRLSALFQWQSGPDGMDASVAAKGCHGVLRTERFSGRQRR